MKAFCIGVLIVMISVTTWASLDSSVFVGGAALLKNPWGVATLCDTYFSFFMIYLWMAYKEPAWFKRVLWLIAVFSLGTIAISIFVLHELFTYPGQSFEAFLFRRKKTPEASLA